MPLSELDYVGMAVPIVSLAIAFLKLYLDQRKVKKELELSKQYLKTLSKLVESHQKSQQLEKDKFEWQKLKDIAKGLWGFIKESEEE